MKKYEIIKREEVEVMEYTSMGDFPRAEVKWTLRDDEGNTWIGYGVDGIRIVNGNEDRVVSPIHEDADPYAKTQCFIDSKDFIAINLFCWGNRPIPRNFDLMGYDRNPGSDKFGIWLRNRITGRWVIGQAGILKNALDMPKKE